MRRFSLGTLVAMLLPDALLLVLVDKSEIAIINTT